MTRLLIWGAIFAGGVWVGVQLTKRETASRFKDTADSVLSKIGLGPEKPYGRDATNFVNQGIDRIFQ